MRTIKRVMSFLHLLYSFPASVERLSVFQIDELNEKKTKVVRIRSETNSTRCVLSSLVTGRTSQIDSPVSAQQSDIHGFEFKSEWLL